MLYYDLLIANATLSVGLGRLKKMCFLKMKLRCCLDSCLARSRFAFSSSYSFLFYFIFILVVVVNFSSVYSAHFSNTSESRALFMGPTNFTF